MTGKKAKKGAPAKAGAKAMHGIVSGIADMTTTKGRKKGSGKAALPFETISKRTFESFPVEVQEAFDRVVSDKTAGNYLAGLSKDSVLELLGAYEYSIKRDSWDLKTQRERKVWKQNFDKAIDQLTDYLVGGPLTPDQWGFPARDMVLMNILHRIGIPLPKSDTPEFWDKLLEVEAAADEEQWTLLDALRLFKIQIDTDCEKGEMQLLKKPRDPKGMRAAFIVRMRRYSDASVGAIAAIAQVLFDDVSIDERLVRRLCNSR